MDTLFDYDGGKIVYKLFLNNDMVLTVEQWCQCLDFDNLLADIY